jgi:hypothetical protein
LKKLALAILISMLMTPMAYSAIIITDPDVFYSMFDYPDTTIDFLKLKDGTSFSNIPNGYKANTSYLDNPDNLIIHTGESDGVGGFNFIAVRPHAFSDDWSFERAHPTDSKNNREAVVWFGQGITTGSFELIISSTTPQSKPFVIYTEKGFIGIVPSSPLETRFVFDGFHIIYSLETGFSQVDSVPEPPANNHYWKKPNNYREI